MNYFGFLIGFMVTSSALADFSADIFEMKSNPPKKIYSFKNQVLDRDGMQEAETIYQDLNNNPVVVEKALMRGHEVQKLNLEQKQMDASASIEVLADKIIFKKKHKGEEKTVEERRKGSVVVSSTFQRFARAHWADIMKGKEVEFRFASWERMETVGFEIFKIGEEKFNGKEVVLVKMKPSSFIIAALVNPLTFRFTLDGEKIVAMSGRVAPKQKVGDEWKDLDAEVLYYHP